MRTYIYILISLLISSCQLDLDVNGSLERIPIYDVNIPNNIVINTQQTISFKYAFVNGCYSLHEIESNFLDEDTLATTVYAEVSNSVTCSQVYSEQTYSFTFTPQETKTYFFKFWKGVDSQGMDEYEEYEVVIE